MTPPEPQVAAVLGLVSQPTPARGNTAERSFRSFYRGCDELPGRACGYVRRQGAGR